MRLWHYELLPYLPDAQFKGQLRELVAIMHDWRDKGKTNHLLINRVMEYPKNDFVRYFFEYDVEYHKRYGKWLTKAWEEFKAFDDTPIEQRINGFFEGWHNKEYCEYVMQISMRNTNLALENPKFHRKNGKHFAEGIKKLQERSM